LPAGDEGVAAGAVEAVVRVAAGQVQLVVCIQAGVQAAAEFADELGVAKIPRRVASADFYVLDRSGQAVGDGDAVRLS
jgi:hypothetical protein